MHAGTDLVALFRSVAAEHSAALALHAGGRWLTYRELDGWSDRVAADLLGVGVLAGDRVALRLPASAEAIATILGVLKAGAAYVPLEVRNPPARNEFILADCGASLLVGEPAGIGSVPTLPTKRITELLEDSPDLAVPDLDGLVGDLAYVIYTSGTTGTPKGVPIRHAGVLALLAGMRERFALASTDRSVLLHSLGFDMSVLEIWGCFGFGGGLVVPDAAQLRHPAGWVGLFAEHDITLAHLTPTAFDLVSAVIRDRGIELPALRCLLLGGEKLLSASLRPWVARFGLDRPELHNLYGPTEATVFATTHRVTAADLDGDDSLIGTALPGMSATVVLAGRAAEPGELGELWLAGPQLSSGYVNRDDLTSARFAPADLDGTGPVPQYRTGDLCTLRPDGVISYQGRSDLQIKLRGYRVELTDVEAAVRGFGQVDEAVVTVVEPRPGEQHLMCVLVAAVEPDLAALRAHVAATLPNYMHPVRYLRIDELPLTLNGKLDRAAVAKRCESELPTSAQP